MLQCERRKPGPNLPGTSLETHHQTAWCSRRPSGGHPMPTPYFGSLTLQYEQDLSVLRALEDPSQVIRLKLRFGDLSDLSPLTSLQALTELRLHFCGRVRDLGPLTELP